MIMSKLVLEIEHKTAIHLMSGDWNDKNTDELLAYMMKFTSGQENPRKLRDLIIETTNRLYYL